MTEELQPKICFFVMGVSAESSFSVLLDFTLRRLYINHERIS
jgi:hypothetical protein